MFRSHSTVVFSGFVFSGLCLIAANPRADLNDPIGKLAALDNANSDNFGTSIAVSGTTAIVGAPFDDENGNNSGSAYLFDTATGTQLAKLLPSDGAANNQFGLSVGISGTTAIVGAHRDLNDAGSAYLFDTVTGLQLAKLLPNDGAPNEYFGYSVAISGTTAIVGAYGHHLNGGQPGAAYIFDTVTGLQSAKLVATDGAHNERFGRAVAISGTTALIGADEDDDNGAKSGSAYLFDTTSGLQFAKLLASDGFDLDNFGAHLAIEGTRAIVGSIGDDDNGGTSGSAYLFDSSTGLQLAKLLASDGSAGDRFGYSVGISGTKVLIGASQDDDNGLESGSAYLFDMDTGLELHKLLPDDGASFDEFGQAVAISGMTALVGTPKSDLPFFDSGTVYQFEIPGLASESSSISLGTGGLQTIELDGGVERAGWTYFMFGSVTGTTPGIDFGGGVVLPLNFDIYLSLTLKSPGLGIFGNFRSTLDGMGQATASFALPVLMDPSLIGVTLNHAYVAGPVLGSVDFASNAVPVMLVP